jgi:hypothetical protein
VFKKRPKLLNSAPTSTESALRLLSATSVRFWQQTAICSVSLWALVVELHPLNWARAQAVRRTSDKEEIQENAIRELRAITESAFQEAFPQWKKRWERCIASRGGLLWRGQRLKCSTMSNKVFIAKVRSFFEHALYFLTLTFNVRTVTHQYKELFRLQERTYTKTQIKWMLEVTSNSVREQKSGRLRSKKYVETNLNPYPANVENMVSSC